METVLDAKHAGQFREGYDSYAELLQLFANGGHQSTLLITSREVPRLLNRAAQQSQTVVDLQLSGLSPQASTDLLAADYLEASNETTTTLTNRYSGNPLALKLVAQTIDEFYFGDVEAFLADESLIFDDIRDVLAQQFHRLTPLEQEIMVWLATIREPTPPQELSILLSELVHQKQLLEAMKKLQRRSLLERARRGFTLQNVITEYLTDYLVTQICAEVQSESLNLLTKHALLLARTEAYIRQTQDRIILQPIGRQLRAMFDSDDAIRC